LSHQILKNKKMAQEDLILDKLSEIAKKLDEQNILQKTVLNFSETCRYLDVSESHLYKLTSTKQIPHFCPQGKKLYFKRVELDEWLQRNRQSSSVEIDALATEYILKNKRK
jgi:excisionase family DNA binding protein